MTVEVRERKKNLNLPFFQCMQSNQVKFKAKAMAF